MGRNENGFSVAEGKVLMLLSLCSLQAELTFCTGDIITVFGEIDEDGFYYVSWVCWGTQPHQHQPGEGTCKS